MIRKLCMEIFPKKPVVSEVVVFTVLMFLLAQIYNEMTCFTTFSRAPSDFNPEWLKFELVGSWLWVSGKTFQVKDSLKDLGFRYSANKLSW